LVLLTYVYQDARFRSNEVWKQPLLSRRIYYSQP